MEMLLAMEKTGIDFEMIKKVLKKFI